MILAKDNLEGKSENLVPVIEGMYSLLDSLTLSETGKTVTVDFREEFNMLKGRPSMFAITDKEIILFVNTIVHVTDIRNLDVNQVINTIKLTVKANLRS